MSAKRKSGFTLIELLVVISIIGVLSMIGLITYSSVYRSSRDAKRKSDLKLIQSALEQYNGDQKYYPFTVTTNGPLSAGAKIYLNKIPQDPSGSTKDYSYVPLGTNCSSSSPQNCTSYCLSANLETSSGVNSDPSCVPSCTPTSGYNCGITRP